MTFKQFAPIMTGLVLLFIIGYLIGVDTTKRPTYEYQVICGQYSNQVYSDGKFIGEIPVDTSSPFDKLIIQDNQ